MFSISALQVCHFHYLRNIKRSCQVFPSNCSGKYSYSRVRQINNHSLCKKSPSNITPDPSEVICSPFRTLREGFIRNIYNFCWRRWGSWLPGLRMPDSSLGPPSTPWEIFWRTCREGPNLFGTFSDQSSRHFRQF